MSTKYTGGFITKSPVAPTTTAASGIWTLDQQQQAQKAGTWPSPPVFIEDLFSTYLYTGNGTSQTITNGIDLSGSGGLVWLKERNNARSHFLQDSARTITSYLSSDNTDAASSGNAVTALTSTGFTLGSQSGSNGSGNTYVSWTFREQPKFFDIVTWTGNGTGNRAISHALGSAPGCIIVKNTLTGGTNWMVYHRGTSNPNFNYTRLNLTNATNVSGDNVWDVTSTTFQAASLLDLNNNGQTYVAYLFAHDAGGFPASGSGSTNGISCGSFTVSGGNASVTLGYEPQWVLVKNITDTGIWLLFDNMRGMSVGGGDAYLAPNNSNSESSGTDFINPTATGFNITNLGGSQTFIYIAIRRGPMKTPTVGTSVFSPDLYTGNGSTQTITSGSPPLDLVWIKGRTGSNNPRLYDRLRGATISLAPDSTAAETTRTGGLTAFTQNGFSVGANGNENDSGVSIIAWDFKRAPGFFDEVCYTGTGSATTVTHNLAAVPELMIVKSRSTGSTAWYTYVSSEGASRRGFLNYDFAWGGPDNSIWNGTTPTSTVFSLGADSNVNGSGATFVAYLFATCAGVSKVGSYTGTGAAQTINCGFTTGARFVFIKRTDSTGDWYVWDSARGIVAGDDPYLLLNTSTNEVTGTDYIDTANSGFEISSTAPAAINASAGTFIFLAIA
jgi:hypothetical protein